MKNFGRWIRGCKETLRELKGKRDDRSVAAFEDNMKVLFDIYAKKDIILKQKTILTNGLGLEY